MAKSIGTALVTGVSRGLGQHIARSLADEGYNLVLASRSVAETDAFAAELRSRGSAALSVPTDIIDEQSVQRLVSAAEREFGGVDVLVNNAGGDPQREFDQMAWAENEDIFRLNVLAHPGRGVPSEGASEIRVVDDGDPRLLADVLGSRPGQVARYSLDLLKRLSVHGSPFPERDGTLHRGFGAELLVH